MLWGRKRKKPEEKVVIYPWVAWSEQDTEKARRLIQTVFSKDASQLDGSEASAALEMLQTNREDISGMIIPKAMAGVLTRMEGISMDPEEQDLWGRKRYPEIVREIGFSQEVMEELKIGFRR